MDIVRTRGALENIASFQSEHLKGGELYVMNLFPERANPWVPTWSVENTL